jgi:hypothetical protein
MVVARFAQVGITTPAAMSGGVHMVLCTKHNRSRLSKFCVSRPVKDAEGSVVSLAYQCLDDNECTSGGAGGPRDGPAVAATDPATMTEAMRLYGQQSNGRYYDLAKTTGGIESQQRRVCFVCGMQDHDRSNCPSFLCRNCREPMDNNGRHVCAAPTLSPFVALDDLSAAELADVRCSLCNQLGHFDCAGIENPPAWRPRCSFCAIEGHHGFDCPHATRDRWAQQQQQLLREKHGVAAAPLRDEGRPAFATGNDSGRPHVHMHQQSQQQQRYQPPPQQQRYPPHQGAANPEQGSRRRPRDDEPADARRGGQQRGGERQIYQF